MSKENKTDISLFIPPGTDRDKAYDMIAFWLHSEGLNVHVIDCYVAELDEMKVMLQE